jgi:carboxyl-terminal processing protease
MTRLGPFVIAGMLLAACGASDSAGIHARMGWSEDGLRVVHVPGGGPAAEAGLEEGDRVVSIDGAPVSMLTMNEAVDRLRGKPGTRCELEVLREGEVLVLQIPRLPHERRR